MNPEPRKYGKPIHTSDGRGGMENTIIYRAYSILHGIMPCYWPEMPSLEEARDIIAWADRTPTK